MTERGAIGRRALLGAAALLPAARAAAAPFDKYFATSDGVRLHYIDAGAGRAVVFVPGWCMPAWIWSPQLEGLSRTWRTVALDPRGQGESQIAPAGYEPTRRGRDIAELIERLGVPRVVLAGWSLGVLDVLSYLDMAGDRRVAGLVLVDNSVGEGTPPRAVRPGTFIPALRRNREPTLRAFVRGMYKTPQSESYLEAVTQDALRTPLPAAVQLLSYPRPREFWRDALYSTQRPVFYAVTPRLRGQASLVAERHPNATVDIYEDAGHALFVDQAARFNATLEEFLARKAQWA